MTVILFYVIKQILDTFGNNWCSEQGGLMTDGDDMPLGLLNESNRCQILWEGTAGCWMLVL